LSITPNQGLNTAPVDVVITGENFIATPTVRLGSNDLTVSAVTATTINATVPAGLAPGVYALTVINPDLQSDTLPAAYLVIAPTDPDLTLEAGYLMNTGTDAPPANGDDDHVQVIFFEVPASYGGQLWFRIYDADTGGGGITDGIDEMRTGAWNTSMTYTLYGGSGAYTGARAAHPGPGQITAGTELTQTTIANAPAYHDAWTLVFGPYTAAQGEAVGSSRVFKLVVQGGSGDDGNFYHATMSTAAGSNTAPANSRAFAYSWTFIFTSAGTRPPLYPHVPAGTSTFEQFNMDFDYVGSGGMTLHTPIQDLPVPASGISGDGVVASSLHPVGAGETGVTWTVTSDFAPAVPWNNVTFWAVGNG
jgi:hypothetical protein